MRVLVADDAALFRRVLADALAALPGIEVVGTASNGRLALQKVRELQPDLLTLDVEMPEMNGLEVLDALRRSGPAPEVLMVSSCSRQQGDLVMRALQKGALDFITKPEAASPQEGRQALTRDLAPLMRAAAHRCDVRRILRGRPEPAAPIKPTAPGLSAAPVPMSAREPAFHDVSARMNRLADPRRPEFILIGSSTGGPAALARILPEIPGDIGVPVLVVQHMPPVFTKSLAENLAPKCAVRVVEASQGERPLPNTVYIAPGGQQMRLGCSAGERPVLEITDDPPENNCRPAVDYLFRSAAGSYPGRTLAVILTGMGSDGAQGLRALKRQGCFVIAQDEPSCVVYGMPKAAVEAGVVDMVLPLESIAARIAARIRGGRA